MKLYLVAGEASGDARGAELMKALHLQRPDIRFFGAGGPRMKTLAGGKFQDWSAHAVVGIIEALRNYGYFKKQFDAMLAEIAELKPDAVILIDYPGFNLRLAAALKKTAAHPKIIYYISPQVWAWNRRRIPKMARILDLMICIFPFEKALYEKSGLKTVFAGHPLVDSLAARKTGETREIELVGLFPGSRRKEVEKIFPVMIQAARLMKHAQPYLRFEAAAVSSSIANLMQTHLHDDLCVIRTNASHDLMQRAGVAMVASGTATLEAAYFGLPFVILYKVSPLTALMGKLLIRVRFLGMVNILAGREIVREFLNARAKPEAVAREMLRLAKDESAREAMRRDLAAVTAMLGEGGASDRAAKAVLAETA